MIHLARKNIQNLKPYSSARHEFKGTAKVYLDANESPFNNGMNRYPDPMQWKVKKRLASLSLEIRAADALYYQDDNPAISDAEYDALRKELIALEAEYPHLIKKNSPTQSVGVKVSSRFGKMLRKDQVRKWIFQTFH